MVLSFGAGAIGAQQKTSGPPTPLQSIPSVADGPATNENPEAARMEATRQKFFTDERHKRIVADTDRLLQLATELRGEVTTTTKNELSLAVIKKAAEIEKLAHDVKERMKQ